MSTIIFDSITDIELSDEKNTTQLQAVFITDLRVAVEFEHPVRLTVLKILSRGIEDTVTNETVDERTGQRTIIQRPVVRDALSVNEIVILSKKHEDIQDLTRNMVNHHLPRMAEMGHIRKYGTLTTGKRVTDYYQRTAKQFVVTMETPHFGRGFINMRETKRIDKTLQAFKIDIDDGARRELVELLVNCELLKDKWRADIASLVRNDITEPDVVNMYHWLLDAYALGSKEYVQIFKRIREILFKDDLEGN